jgi:hypothetical protein
MPTVALGLATRLVEEHAMLLRTNSTRVEESTAAAVNREIAVVMEKTVACTAAGGRAVIRHRLAELDREWDIERMLELNAATVSLLGLALGATVSRRWYALPAVVAAFLAQHAVQGWCPPLPIFRRLGVRTQSEIDQERYALKALRGDFRVAEGPEETAHERAGEVLAAVRA